MRLETQRLLVIPCTEKTVEITINQAYDNGPEISTYLTQLKADPSLLNWGSWLVIKKSDGTVIGDIGFKGKPDENRVVEIGYGLLEDYRNKGFATEAVGVLIHWAFSTSKVDKIVAKTLHDNYGSIRVLEKLNMKQISKTDTMINWAIEKNKSIV